MSAYTLGSLVHLEGTFTDAVTNQNVDPDVVRLKLRDPNNVITTFPLTPDAPGVYSHDVDAELPGKWDYRFEGTGTHQAAFEGSFTVNKSKFA